MKKQWSGKRPVMFYQEANVNGPATDFPRSRPSQCDRLRIFYPDGKSEWASLTDHISCYFFGVEPCWSNCETSMGLAIEKAKKYDRENGYSKMEFICEL